jgi:LytR cell envelope-related transcriptional attenuator
VDVAIDIGIYAGTAAFFGLAFLLPLYFSQARDVRRLRTWMALTPDGRRAELEVAQAQVAEAPPTPAEPVPAPAAEPRPVPGLGPAEGAPAAAPPAPPPTPAPAPGGVTPAPGRTPVRPLSPAERIALDRPATARITAERAAVGTPAEGMPRLGRLGTSRGLAAVVAGVLALGIAVVFVSLQLSEEGGREARERTPAVVPSEVEVAVLNGTAEPGLAAKVGDSVEANGFVVGNVTNSESPFEDTVVMFTSGNEREAQAVANKLGAVRVQPMDAETRAAVGGAGVAVIAGEDRAGDL